MIFHGKILRIKKGYNPNSSSMGSIIFAFPVALMGIATLYGVASAVIVTKLMRKTSTQGDRQHEQTNHTQVTGRDD
ncbi:MAG: hypothetical protein GY874_08870 [Desulfobacteraceae bacterium]|nr:hypothetical protein [Desulfobacteraceae bacterium]